MKMQFWLRRARWIAALWVATLLLSAEAKTQTALPGDVNGDGAINVLDVQGAINMALAGGLPAMEGEPDNVPGFSFEADVDESAQIDVLDIQVITNTALGAGGLLQTISGTFAAATDAPGGVVYTLVAVSEDGRLRESAVDPVTGAFTMQLDTRTSWALSLQRTDASGTQTTGSLLFPISTGLSTTLPLPGLSTNTTLDFGDLLGTLGETVETDVRSILADAAAPVELEVSDSLTTSDLIADLIGSLPFEIPGLDLNDIIDLSEDAYFAELDRCLADVTTTIDADLTGLEVDGIPDVLDPFVACVVEASTNWIESSVIPIPNELIELYNAFLVDLLDDDIETWLAQFGRAELEDMNGNAVPDFIEDAVCPVAPVPAELSAIGLCVLDTDQNGVPEFAEDDDADTISNWSDPDARTEADADGDGVPSDRDIDADGDGVPDYAAAAGSGDSAA